MLPNSSSCSDLDLQEALDNCPASAAGEAGFVKLASVGTSEDAAESDCTPQVAASYATAVKSVAAAGPSGPSGSAVDYVRTRIATAADPALGSLPGSSRTFLFLFIIQNC